MDLLGILMRAIALGFQNGLCRLAPVKPFSIWHYTILDSIPRQVEYYLTEHTISDSIASMAKVKESVWLWVCERCGYKWLPRDADVEPKRCPGCKSPYWNRPRKAKKK